MLTFKYILSFTNIATWNILSEMLIVTITHPMITLSLFCLELITVMNMDQVISISHCNYTGILVLFEPVMSKLD